MIDWELIAKQYGLTPAEFQNQILTCAAVVGAMALEKDGGDAMKFTCPDQVGTIMMIITKEAASNIQGGC